MNEATKGLATAAALGACAVALAVLPATASAATVICGGTAAPSTEPNADRKEMAYAIHCTEPIMSYSIVSNKPLDSFGPDTSVDPSPSGQQGKLFSCEGRIPSMGFGCSGGTLPVGGWVRSSFVTQTTACFRPKKPLRVFVVGVDAKGNVSEPFRVKTPKCAIPKKKTKSKRHAG